MQAKGSKSRLLLDFEESYKTAPGSPAAKVMPFNTCGVRGSRALNTAQTITGRRDPVAPFAGNLDVSGDIAVPVDVRSLGWWLLAMFGAPTTTAATRALAAAAVTDKGSGKVGLPATAHGLAAGQYVRVAGTTNYNDTYLVDSATTDDEIVVTATYQAEVLDGSETWQPVRKATLDDGEAVVDKGDGTVGLPATAHGLQTGAPVTIAGTTNYNDDYTVLAASTADEIVVTATYQAETIGADATAISADLFDHVYKVGDTMPSFILDKQFQDIAQYMKYMGCRVGRCSMSVGGDGELVATLGVVGATETPSVTAYDSTPDSMSFERFQNFQASIEEAGVALANCTEVSFDLDFGLETDAYVIGDQGTRGSLPEGLVGISGNLSALFENMALLAKAQNQTETSLRTKFAKGVFGLDILFPEVVLEQNTPGIDGPRGVRVQLPWRAYFDNASADSAVVVTLSNDVVSYA